MKKIFLAVAVIISLSIQAQNELPNTALPSAVEPIVSLPKAYLDWLRYNSTGWSTELYDSTNQNWRNYAKEQWVKDEDKRLIKYVGMFWDNTAQKWYQTENNNSYIKDQANLLISEIRTTPDEGITTSLFYNPQNRLIQTIDSTFTNQNWTGMTTTFISYDGNNRRVYDSLVAGKTTLSSFMRHYECNGNNLCSKEFVLAKYGAKWDTASKTEYIYFTNGQLKKMINSIMFLPEQKLKAYYENSYTYTSDGRLETLIASKNLTLPQFKQESFKHYYDAMGRFSAFTYRKLNANSIDPEDSIAFSYSKTGLYDSAYTFLKDGEGWSSKPTYRMIIDKITVTTGINKIDTYPNTISVYPNPATDKVFIEFTDPSMNLPKSIAIYDITGREVKNVTVESHLINISLTDIASGMYYLQIGASTIKFIKE